MSLPITILDANNARQTVQVGALPDGASTAARQDAIIALLQAMLTTLEGGEGLQMRLALTGLTGGGDGDLDALPTATRATSLIVGAVIDSQLGFWQLQASTAATASPTVIRPTDYASSNQKVWRKVL